MQFENHQIPASPYEMLPDLIWSLPYDYIAVFGCTGDVIASLKEYGVSRQKILNLAFLENQFTGCLYEKSLVLSSIKSSKNISDYKVLVTGLSYAYFGTELGSYGWPAVNLAGVSQDLYYDYLMANTVLSFPQTDFRFAVIGLAPYSFHSNLSVGAENYRVLSYVLALKDAHDFPADAEMLWDLFQPKFDQSVIGIESYLESNRIDLNDPIGVRKQMDFKMGDRERLKGRKRAETWKTKRFPNTKKENLKIFQDYIEMCLEHHVTPVCVVFPVTDIYRRFFSRQILEEFYQIMDDMQQKYDVKFLNLFANEEFTYDDFHDVDHLNRTGAGKCSMIINKCIMKNS